MMRSMLAVTVLRRSYRFLASSGFLVFQRPQVLLMACLKLCQLQHMQDQAGEI